MFRAGILALLLSLFAITPLEAFESVHTATITEVIDGDTVFIDPPYGRSDEIRLVGIQAPKLPLGRYNFPAWPLAEEAKQYLSDLVLGKQVSLSFTGGRMDRHRRWLAHLHLIEGENRIWVQGDMLRNGFARVYSFSDNRGRVADMLTLESRARAAKRGIWALDYYAVRSANPWPLLKELDTFQLIEGRVVDAADVRGRIYLNFGENWRDDFTASIERKYRKSFMESGLDPLSLGGQRIRVRGWLDNRNGPMVRLTHPEQIEILGR